MTPRVSIAIMASALLSITVTSAFAIVPRTGGSPSEANSPAALYNQGNAAARAGRPAEAVLDFERARLLAPHDPDIRANLQHVRTEAGLATPGNWFTQHARFANPNLMFWLATFGITLTGAGLVAARLNKAQRKPFAVAAIVGLALTFAGVADAIATASALKAAVVMQASPARAAPIPAAAALFTVPQAEVVSMLEEHGKFTLVRDAQNREGWLPQSVLSPIIPKATSP